MGQKPSHNITKPKLSLTWVLRTQQFNHHQHQQQPRPEQPIKFQYKTRRKNVDITKEKLNTDNIINGPFRAKSEPNLNNNSSNNNNNVSSSSNSADRSIRDKHRHRKRSQRKSERHNRFGYEIDDVDAFLTKASLEKPANIPVVLAFPSVLYQTRLGGYQEEISLPLGMVVNAVFKNQSWLYVQTPHAEEGYVTYTSCLPLGILPPRDDEPAPCWEKNTDIFPKPCGNMTDTEKLSEAECCDPVWCRERQERRSKRSRCGERSLDRLYLRACARNRSEIVKRQTLLVVVQDFEAVNQRNAITVWKGDVVVLIGTPFKDWFWVRTKDGREGFIPAAVAGHGFL